MRTRGSELNKDVELSRSTAVIKKTTVVSF